MLFVKDGRISKLVSNDELKARKNPYFANQTKKNEKINHCLIGVYYAWYILCL